MNLNINTSELLKLILMASNGLYYAERNKMYNKIEIETQTKLLKRVHKDLIDIQYKQTEVVK